MGKLFFIIFFASLGLNLSAQSLEIEYRVRVNKNSVITTTETRYYLKIKGQVSTYYNTLEDSLSQYIYAPHATTSYRAKAGFLVAKLDDHHSTCILERIYFKDYSSHSVIFNELINGRKLVHIKESYPLFDWKLLPNRDTIILGYPCQRAVAEFRGRTYVACFSPTLYPFGGPWKFEGLPGLILQVQSEDNYFIINPVKITLNANIDTIENPHAGKETLSWEAYVEATKADLQQSLKKMKAMSAAGDDGGIKIVDSIEDMGIGELSFRK
ncbi:MAG: GLPGLI family protein [Microscillaceae bacterium]|nr:GLPGLI family protein [Microscillaceae bacterium]